jgi:hypothetical protein
MASAAFAAYVFQQFASALAKCKREAKRHRLDDAQMHFNLLNVQTNMMVATLVALGQGDPKKIASLSTSVVALLQRTVKQATDEVRGDNIVIPDTLPKNLD